MSTTYQINHNEPSPIESDDELLRDAKLIVMNLEGGIRPQRDMLANIKDCPDVRRFLPESPEFALSLGKWNPYKQLIIEWERFEILKSQEPFYDEMLRRFQSNRIVDDVKTGFDKQENLVLLNSFIENLPLLTFTMSQSSAFLFHMLVRIDAKWVFASYNKLTAHKNKLIIENARRMYGYTKYFNLTNLIKQSRGIETMSYLLFEVSLTDYTDGYKKEDFAKKIISMYLPSGTYILADTPIKKGHAWFNRFVSSIREGIEGGRYYAEFLYGIEGIKENCDDMMRSIEYGMDSVWQMEFYLRHPDIKITGRFLTSVKIEDDLDLFEKAVEVYMDRKKEEFASVSLSEKRDYVYHDMYSQLMRVVTSSIYATPSNIYREVLRIVGVYGPIDTPTTHLGRLFKWMFVYSRSRPYYQGIADEFRFTKRDFMKRLLNSVVKLKLASEFRYAAPYIRKSNPEFRQNLLKKILIVEDKQTPSSLRIMPLFLEYADISHLSPRKLLKYICTYPNGCLFDYLQKNGVLNPKELNVADLFVKYGMKSLPTLQSIIGLGADPYIACTHSDALGMTILEMLDNDNTSFITLPEKQV